MSNDTNMDNRILAEFEGWTFIDKGDTIVGCLNGEAMFQDFPSHYTEILPLFTVKFLYHRNYNALHRVWEKFRELRFDDLHLKTRLKHANLCQAIAHAMAYGTLKDFYNALVNAVKWYNEVTKQKQ